LLLESAHQKAAPNNVGEIDPRSKMMTSIMDSPGVGEYVVEHLVQLLGLDVEEAVLVLDAVRLQLLFHFLLVSTKNVSSLIRTYS